VWPLSVSPRSSRVASIEKRVRSVICLLRVVRPIALNFPGLALFSATSLQVCKLICAGRLCFVCVCSGSSSVFTGGHSSRSEVGLWCIISAVSALFQRLLVINLWFTRARSLGRLEPRLPSEC
jgi:hypothetical protein